MAVVHLRSPLKQQAGNQAQHPVEGATVVELMRASRPRTRRSPAGSSTSAASIRRHINVFVNGERGDEETAVGADDRVDVLPAISGGAR